MTPEISSYLDERLRSLEKFLGSDADHARCEVEIGRDAGRPRHGKNIWMAEINITYPGSETIRATNHAESVNAAIDDVKEEMERLLRSERKLHTRLMRQGGAFAKYLMRFGREE